MLEFLSVMIDRISWFRQKKTKGYFEKWQESILRDINRIFNVNGDTEKTYFLDIGTPDNSYPVVNFANKRIRSIGINISENSIKKAKDNIKSNNILNDKRLADFFVADGRALPFRGEVFKYVTCISTLEHISDDDAAIAEISRVISREGILYILVPNDYKAMPCVTRWHYRWIDKSWGGHTHYSIDALICKLKDIGGFNLADYGYRGHLTKVFQEFLNLWIPDKPWSARIWWRLEKMGKALSANRRGVHMWMAPVKE